MKFPKKTKRDNSERSDLYWKERWIESQRDLQTISRIYRDILDDKTRDKSLKYFRKRVGKK